VKGGEHARRRSDHRARRGSQSDPVQHVPIAADTPQTRYSLGDAEAMAKSASDLSDHDFDQMVAGMFG
jgi:hypothetical protein